MRRIVFAALILLALPSVGAADDASLPPPQIVVRRRAGLPVAPPATPPLPASVRAPRPRPRPPPPPETPSQYAIERSVDAYLRDARPLLAPTSRGSAGYEEGFLVRQGAFLLRVNGLLQARYEAFRWNDGAPASEGDRSGFSLPRAVVRLSGEVSCRMRYLVEVDAGDEGGPLAFDTLDPADPASRVGPPDATHAFGALREAWLEWSPARWLDVRGGKLRTPTTRQLMVGPGQQQFVDVALASAWTGAGLPGYTDRNRDFGLMLHGTLGGNEDLAWMLSATQGRGADGPRGVLDRGSSRLAWAARVNWAFLRPLGYAEDVLRTESDPVYGEVGAWGHYAPTLQGDFLRGGLDLALGRGPWSFTGALTWSEDRDVGGFADDTSTAWLAQLGHRFLRSPWELAVRTSGYDTEGDRTGSGRAAEYALAMNYHLDVHGTKLQLDAAFVDTSSGGFLLLDPYAAYPAFLRNGATGWLLRFQWQLAF